MTALAASRQISPEAFFTIREQTMFFLLSVVMGAGFGVIFDVFRALRVIFPFLRRKAATAVCDALFILMCGFGIYVFSLTFALGSVRAYFAVGAFLGWTIYILTVGTAVMTIIRRIFGWLYNIIQKVYISTDKHIGEKIRRITHKKRLQNCNKRRKNQQENKKQEKHLPKPFRLLYNITVKMKEI